MVKNDEVLECVSTIIFNKTEDNTLNCGMFMYKIRTIEQEKLYGYD